jgi:hypothetical protein
LQAGAAGWLAQHAIFADAAKAHSGFRTIDSETLRAKPQESLAALAAGFDIELDAAEVAAGPAFRTHSKDRSNYSPEQRDDDHEKGRDRHAREIGIVVQWAEQLAAHAGIPIVLPEKILT